MNIKFKTVLLFASLVIALSVLSLILYNTHFYLWEKFIRGPYLGLEYSSSLPTASTNSLILSHNYSLEVFSQVVREGEDDWPVIAVRSTDQNIKWARLLKPRVVEPSGKTDYPFVRDIRLHCYKSSGTMIKVIFSCRWGKGGDEKGIIYLTQDCEFLGFSIAW